MLQGRCRYLLIDDFDFETVRSFLGKYGFTEKEVNLVWSYFGGKPVYLVEAIKNEHRLKEFCEEMLKMRVRQIKDFIYGIEERDRESYERIMELFRRFENNEAIEYERLNEEIKLCIRNNVFFVDSMNDTLKTQSKLDLLALRMILK